MNTKQTIISVCVALGMGLTGVAYAKGPGCDGEGPMRGAMMRDGDMGKMMVQRGEKRLERLHSALKITPEQESLWRAFADKTRAEMGKGMAMRDANREAAAKLTAPERMDKMQSTMKERLAAMETVNDSFKQLYAGLSEQQKSVADTHFSRMGPGRHDGPRNKGGMGPGGQRGPGAPGGTAAAPIKG
jgi:hypothetical protein